MVHSEQKQNRMTIHPLQRNATKIQWRSIKRQLGRPYSTYFQSEEWANVTNSELKMEHHENSVCIKTHHDKQYTQKGDLNKIQQEQSQKIQQEVHKEMKLITSVQNEKGFRIRKEPRYSLRTLNCEKESLMDSQRQNRAGGPTDRELEKKVIHKRAPRKQEVHVHLGRKKGCLFTFVCAEDIQVAEKTSKKQLLHKRP